MHARFIHAADIHLGYEQYNLVERADDFARAYLAVVDHAIQHRVDFILIAGDLFHRASADAWMLKQATAGLTALRYAGIPVVAVEGNHDAQHARKHLSWLEFLCDQELLILLNIQTAANGSRVLAPWDPDTRRGSWIDIAGVRIYGMKYYGAITARFLDEVRDQIEPVPGGYTILMLHAGIEGQVPHLHGGLTPAQLAPFHENVDYLALGHVHKRLAGLGGWIYNPGSTETNSMEEFEWPHGFFDVRVDTASPEKHDVTAVETPSLRPFHRIAVHADGTPTLDEFVALAEERIAATRDLPPNAVIELALGGVAQFKRQDIPVERLRAAVQLRFSPLVVRVRNSVVPPGLVTVRHGERLRRADLERQVVEQLVYQLGDYRDRAAAWTRLILDVKNMAAERSLPASIADHIQDSLRQMDACPPEADIAVPDLNATSEAVSKPAAVLVPAETPPACAGGDDEPTGGEPPCMAQLFEDW
jgi:exonuclease SbcD